MATIWWNNEIAKRRMTTDLLLSEQNSADILKSRRDFISLRDQERLIEHFDQAFQSENALTIANALNRYELTAIAIKNGSLSYKMYRRWCRSTVIKDWIECKPFIMEIRKVKKNPCLYCEFEWLAKKLANRTERISM
jgi:hypothetical protein